MNRYALLLLLLPLSTAASAAPPAQAPLTGRMLGAATGSSPAPTTPLDQPAPPALSAPIHTQARDQAGIGRTTRSLLQLQASGNAAAPALPLLGDQADASYRRYLRSFEHDIPVFFEATVGDDAPTGTD